MIFMLLKVAGLDYMPEHILNDWALEPSRIWQVGEPSPVGEPYEDSGFNITLPNQESWPAALSCLEDFLEDKTEMFHELIGYGANMELHVGMSLPAGEAVSSQLVFSQSLLAELVAREIDLSVIAFPESESS